ncbi:MAG: hypothetical protein AAFU79_12210 [Myxococcota bacterium]
MEVSALPTAASPYLSMERSREANRGLTGLILASFVLHGVLVGGAVIAAEWSATPRVDVNALPVELVSLGKPRDPKLLPRKVRRRAATSPQEAAPDPAPSAKAPDAVALEGKKPPKAKSRPKKKLSATARALLEDDGEASALDDALAKLEEAEGIPEGSRLGTTTDPSQAASAYEAQVAAVLRSRYKLPLTIPSAQRRFLEAELVLFIDRRGRLVRHAFTKRHPNAAFMGALENLLRSVEFPAPPSNLARTYATQGLAVRFKPD